ncbi:MAG TPA: trypsin-like peptidase domain-containing protein [Gemmatimonadales bacterium]|jgi:S1-C subfamily serine protease|nr:trypsin-like peptidase domain-containing protein [Gemmatimonadales bacterium]
MSIRLEIRAGERVGQAVTLDKTYITIGRHPAADVRFEAYYEAPISARHAAVVRREPGWVVRDLGSAAGTFVNGERVVGDLMLESGDVIELGRGGPVTQVSFLPEPVTRDREALPVQRVRPTAAELRLRPAPSSGITVASIEQATRRRQAAIRRRGILAGILVTAVATGWIWHAGRSGQREELLRRQMRDTAQRQREIISTAMLDLARIARENRSAVALVVAQFDDGSSFSGTGFVVRSSRGEALIVTNRHLVTTAGARSRRLSVVLDGSSQTWPAEIVSVHGVADLALLRVKTPSRLPAVRAIAPSTAAIDEGAPVAMLGYPLGLDLQMGGDWREVGVSATSMQGTVSRVLPTLVQVDGYGAQGSSGSPIFNARGEVVAVLYGSERDSAGRIIYGVPVRFVHELLRDAPRLK